MLHGTGAVGGLAYLIHMFTTSVAITVASFCLAIAGRPSVLAGELSSTGSTAGTDSFGATGSSTKKPASPTKKVRTQILRISRIDVVLTSIAIDGTNVHDRLRMIFVSPMLPRTFVGVCVA